ncbi:protein BRANCHLESS TRICHOME-like [Phalaenopsis equestris]|uniref:protein BRANCHLESS TRICHOME-like n=1 Tax=Phalaenopsis equestris TaxID=78828 RepID=UPI0009E4BA33|nr:protein BRANCHLESS TRICHOME-like [Phalaenopsis equestris]
MDSPSLPWKLYQNPHFSSESHHDSNPHLLPLHNIETDPHPSSQTNDLRTDLEVERRLRRDAESLTRSLSLKLAEERRLRAEAEAEAARCRDEADRAVQEAEEERQMLKYADAWREERVQMKLTEAAIVLEEKMMEIAKSGVSRSSEVDGKGRQGRENPLIKKCVKGSAESPKTAGKARSPGFVREKERADKKLECQKSQIGAFLRQKSASNFGVMANSRSLVVR